MTARLFLDTSILFHALDPADPLKRKVPADFLSRTISSRILALSPQSLNEAYRVLTQGHKFMPLAETQAYLGGLASWCIVPLDAVTTIRAWSVQDDIDSSWWDRLMLAAALRAQCRLFVTEDMQDGREVSGMRICNPFTDAFAKSLARM